MEFDRWQSAAAQMPLHRLAGRVFSYRIGSSVSKSIGSGSDQSGHSDHSPHPNQGEGRPLGKRAIAT